MKPFITATAVAGLALGLSLAAASPAAAIAEKPGQGQETLSDVATLNLAVKTYKKGSSQLRSATRICVKMVNAAPSPSRDRALTRAKDLYMRGDYLIYQADQIFLSVVVDTPTESRVLTRVQAAVEQARGDLQAVEAACGIETSTIPS